MWHCDGTVEHFLSTLSYSRNSDIGFWRLSNFFQSPISLIFAFVHSGILLAVSDECTTLLRWIFNEPPYCGRFRTCYNFRTLGSSQVAIPRLPPTSLTPISYPGFTSGAYGGGPALLYPYLPIRCHQATRFVRQAQYPSVLPRFAPLPIDPPSNNLCSPHADGRSSD